MKVNVNLLKEKSLQDIKDRFNVNITESGIYKFHIAYLENEIELNEVEKLDINSDTFNVESTSDIITEYQIDDCEDINYYIHWASSKLVDGIWVIRFDENNTEEIIKIKLEETNE
tara:strand:- start:103 stop:447 length:345 start_codon:yes stop_codon:yes gene_type:complete